MKKSENFEVIIYGSPLCSNLTVCAASIEGARAVPHCAFSSKCHSAVTTTPRRLRPLLGGGVLVRYSDAFAECILKGKDCFCRVDR